MVLSPVSCEGRKVVLESSFCWAAGGREREHDSPVRFRSSTGFLFLGGQIRCHDPKAYVLANVVVVVLLAILRFGPIRGDTERDLDQSEERDFSGRAAVMSAGAVEASRD